MTDPAPAQGVEFVSPCPLPSEAEREILNILIEECAEVVQRATKMLRFGRDEVQEGQPNSNAVRLSKELGDLAVLIEMAEAAGLVDRSVIEERKPRKREKLAKYMQSDALSASPARSEAGETQPSEDKIARALCCVGELCVRPEDCIAKRSRLARAQTEAIRKLYASQKDKT